MDGRCKHESCFEWEPGRCSTSHSLSPKALCVQLNNVEHGKVTELRLIACCRSAASSNGQIDRQFSAGFWHIANGAG